MKRKVWIMLFLLCSAAMPAMAAEDPFRVIFRQEDVVSDEAKVTANVLVNVFNGTGEEIKDVTVAISGQNTIFYNSMPVLIGDLPLGQQAEVLRHVEVPKEVADLTVPDDEIIWKVEYTTTTGERKAVDVKGERGI